MAEKTIKTIEIGSSGTQKMAGVIDEEYNAQLSFPACIEVYDKMRKGDATVRAALLAMKLPILAASWTVIPASQEKKDVEVAEFIEHVFFKKLVWRDFLRHILLGFDFGFSVFEKVHLLDNNGKIIYGKIAPRLQKSIQKWEISGGKDGITQQAIKDGSFETLEIPREKLFHIAFDQEGGNLEGVSSLRSAYKHWYFKEAMYKLQAIGAERSGIGIPYAKIPEGVTISEQDREEIIRTLENIRGSEDAYVYSNHGVEFSFLTAGGGEFDFEQAILHHDRQIGKSVLAQFLEIGVTKGGNAQSGSQQELFYNSLQASAEFISEKVNRELVRELVDFNFGEDVDAPKIQCGEIGGDSLEVFALALQRMSQGGIITSDIATENAIRKMMKLPEKEEENTPVKKDSTPKKSAEPIKENNKKQEVKTKKEEDDKKKKELSLSEEKPLYVMRKVKNGSAIASWAKKEGLDELIDTKDLHVTIAFSRDSVDWKSFVKDSDEIAVELNNVKPEKLGEAIVLKFKSKELEKDWKKYIDGGASWDFDGYIPHISISYSGDQDLEKVKSFSGTIKLSGEIFQDLELEDLIESVNLSDDEIKRELTLAEKKIDIPAFNKFYDYAEKVAKKSIEKFSKDMQSKIEVAISDLLEKGSPLIISSSLLELEVKKMAKDIEKQYLASYDFGKTQATREMGKMGRIATPDEVKEYISAHSQTLAQKHADDIRNEAVLAAQSARKISAETAIALKVAKEAMETRALKQIELLTPILTTGGVNQGIGTVYQNFKDEIWGYQYSAVLDRKTTNICKSLDGRVVREYGELPTPSLHLYCRSRIVAILNVQTTKPKENPVPDSVKKSYEGKKWPYSIPKSVVDPSSPAGKLEKKIRKNRI